MLEKGKNDAHVSGELSDELFARIVELARMDPLSPGMTIQRMHLRKVIGMFEVLSDVHIAETDTRPFEGAREFPAREDVVIEFLTHDEAMSNSRLRSAEFFIAPHLVGIEAEDGND